MDWSPSLLSFHGDVTGTCNHQGTERRSHSLIWQQRDIFAHECTHTQFIVMGKSFLSVMKLMSSGFLLYIMLSVSLPLSFPSLSDCQVHGVSVLEGFNERLPVLLIVSLLSKLSKGPLSFSGSLVQWPSGSSLLCSALLPSTSALIHIYCSCSTENYTVKLYCQSAKQDINRQPVTFGFHLNE